VTGGASNRSRGDYFEHQARDALASVGWVVTRAAGSKGPADLVALRDGNTPLLVSCKLNGRIDPGERETLLATAWQAGARPIVADRQRRGWVNLDQLGPGGDRLHVAELQVPRRRRQTHPEEDAEAAEAAEAHDDDDGTTTPSEEPPA
jgi:Holliday junction resolvase